MRIVYLTNYSIYFLLYIIKQIEELYMIYIYNSFQINIIQSKIPFPFDCIHMIEEKQHIFHNFNTSIDDNHEAEEPEEPQSFKIRGRKRASTFTKLTDNKQLDAMQLQDLKSSIFTSYHMFKKFVSSQQIFYGKTSQQELYQMLFDYMNQIIQNPSKLNKQIKSMNFENMQRHECLIEMDTMKLTPKKSSKIDRIFTQNNITHNVSIQFQHSSALSSGMKNSSGRSPSKPQIEEQHVCSQFASIEQVESQRMQESIRIITPEEETEIDEMVEQPPLPPPRRNANVSIKMMELVPNNNDSFEDRVKSSGSSSNNKIRENSIDKRVGENHSGTGKKHTSTTSFGFEFDKRIGGNNILQQVSMLYLNNSRSNRGKSQVSLEIDGDQSSWLSESGESQQPTLEDVADRINIPLTKQFLVTLYYQPQPFLITISLIYFLKYLYHSVHVLTTHSATILLTTSLLVSYKIYQDQPILGLLEYLVEDVLDKKLTREEMVKFQRHFLQSIDYEVVIGNQQFYKMLAMIKGEIVDD